MTKMVHWVTSEVKTAIKRNSRVHREWVLRGRNPDDRHFVRTVQNETNRFKKAKKDDYVNLGSNFDTVSKAFWTAFKRIVNNQKLTNIPLILEDGKFISDFHLKSNIFNDYFAKQCTVNNIPNSLPPLRMDTTSRIHSVDLRYEWIPRPEYILSTRLKEKSLTSFCNLIKKKLMVMAIFPSQCLSFTHHLFLGLLI